ncbi:glycosyl transferase family 1 [Devosia insulae DS-56]|uniref:Glycosyl transferase family 1 n=1 Tax=Devosia insulae DS-56 TaxID=1116389 RepID=A0A1E5XUM1_9HYPH|nr:glycosyltransferase family 4 protein [Devosia insulae]OEO32244.1 glycosyl transferase family 1 [Devosia insulae DS-56]
MRPVHRVAFIGNSLPRRCGIATFTTDLQRALAGRTPDIETTIIAMTDAGLHYDYPPEVGFEVRQEEFADYAAAADFINAGGFDTVSLQHEFGIFGGEAGGYIVTLLERLTVPVVTTLHTVLAEPNPAQRRVLERILALSARVVVMADKGRELLLSTYGAAEAQIEVIPHGIPDVAFVEPDAAKARLGCAGKTVILTFGLLSPNKGIEVMIDAMPAVLAARPDAVYVVLGATHPTLVREQGEAYRESLVARAGKLGIAEHVVFLDQFVDRPALLDHISMCDVYVTPYLNEAQMTSGTLAYSFGLGRAVVSTPYWHALELLAKGRGCLVPFGDAGAIGAEISALLNDEPRRQAMRRRAYATSRSMTWERVADRYAASFEAIRAPQPQGQSVRLHLVGPADDRPRLPSLSLGHLRVMTDDTGLYQHAIHAVPDRAHGYCVDDNARGLLLASALNLNQSARLPETMTATYASFVQYAFNRDTGRFRNFMSFDRRWLEAQGSEDSHGRTLWALGMAARDDVSASRRSWAAELFAAALPVVEGFASPRAWAFTLLGLTGYCQVRPDDDFATQLRLRLASRLVELLRQVETPGWVWFEEGLSYDNARLCEALILSGRATGLTGYVEAGLRTLAWLMQQQTSPSGLFRPVGTAGFTDVRLPPKPFDQQPVEAAATIAACFAAWSLTGSALWQTGASRAFGWFLGRNDLGLPLIDAETGACRDGLHPDRVNENRGGESVVSYLLSLSDMQRFERAGTTQPHTLALTGASRDMHRFSHQQFRGRLAASDISKPSGTLPAP